MLKLIATNGDLQLFQTGFTTVYEGTALEETFPSGYLLNEVGEQIPVQNIYAMFRNGGWDAIAEPDEPLGKGRKRQFATRAEASRYAANIRWANARGESSSSPVPTNPLAVEPTNDIGVAITTGAPFAPLLPENFPPEVKAAMSKITFERGERIKQDVHFAIAQQLLTAHYERVMDPSTFSPETKKLLSEHSDLYYRRMSSESSQAAAFRHEMAGQMASTMARRVAEQKYVKERIGTERALSYTKDMVSSPEKRVAIAVQTSDIIGVLGDGVFKTQFETRKSGGMMNPNIRAAHEAVSYGIHPATLPRARPVYANLHPLGVQSTRLNGSEQYGSVQFVVKRSVMERSTFSVTDSLGMIRTPAAITKKIVVGQPHTMAMATSPKSKSSPESTKGRILRGERYEYAEAQIHGGVSLSDIAYVAVPKGMRLSPPVMTLLKKHGIQVKRISDGPPVSDEEVMKALVGVTERIFQAVQKAKSFGGDRSAAGQYAARIRWGVHSAADKERFKALQLDDAQMTVNAREADRVAGVGFFSFLPMVIPTEKQQEALDNYISDARFINYRARKGEYGTEPRFSTGSPETADRHIAELDGLISRCKPVENDVLLVRGMRIKDSGLPKEQAKQQIANLKVGQSFEDIGFLSASSLGRPTPLFDGAIRLEVVIPKGTKALPVSRFGKLGRARQTVVEKEQEWLLPRKTRFRVIEVRHGEFKPTNLFDSEKNALSLLPQGKPVTIRVVAEPA